MLLIMGIAILINGFIVGYIAACYRERRNQFGFLLGLMKLGWLKLPSNWKDIMYNKEKE